MSVLGLKSVNEGKPVPNKDSLLLDEWTKEFTGLKFDQFGVLQVPDDKLADEPTEEDYSKLEKLVEGLGKTVGQVTDEVTKAAGDSQSVEDVKNVVHPKGRRERAEKLIGALKKVDPVIVLFGQLEAKVKQSLAAAKPDKQQGKDRVSKEKLTELLVELQQKRSYVRAHIPTGFSSDAPNWPALTREQLEPLAADDQKRAEKLKELTDPQNHKYAENVKEVETAGKDLTGAVEKYQVRSMPRAATFFDGPRIGVAMSVEDMKKAQEATRVLAEKGRAILYNGGSYKDVKALMDKSGIKEEFWPPELVDSVQAWRKTQRALNDERVQALAESHAKGEFNAETLQDGWELIGNSLLLSGKVLGLDSKDSDLSLIEQIKNHEGIQEAFTTFFGDILNTGVSAVPSMIEFIKNPIEIGRTLTGDEPDKILKILDKSTNQLFTALDLAVKGSTLAQDFGVEHVIHAVKQFLPGLSIAAAGVDLFNAAKELGKHVKTLSTTKGEQKEGLAQFMDGSADEALLGALSDEFSARKTQIAKDTVKVVNKAANLGGAISGTAGGHIGLAVQAGISVVGGVITVAGKVVFTRIDWNKAVKAQETLKLAQGGNMQAQVEIFEDSGFYAKMYIAVLCRDNQSLAKKFVIDRGIEEGDLDNVQGLRILREALLGDAGQIDDTDVNVEGGFGRYLFGKAGDLVEGAVDLLAKGVQVARSAYTTAYDAKWTGGSAPDTDPKTWETWWTTLKTEAMKHGLINDASGITAALQKAVPILVTSDEAILDPQKTPVRKDTVLAGIKAAGELVRSVAKYSPEAYVSRGSPKKVPHVRVVELLQELRKAGNVKEDLYWQNLKTSGSYQEDWVPAPKLAAIESKLWGELWSAGQQACCLPVGDGGVKAALVTVEKTAGEWEKKKDDTKIPGPDKRKLVQTYIDQLDAVTQSLQVCLQLQEVNMSERLIKEIGEFMMLLNLRKRELDEYLAATGPGKWEPTYDFSDDKVVFATEWNKVWQEAGIGGHRDDGIEDAGLAAALAVVDNNLKTISAAQGKSSQELLQACFDLRSDAGAVRKAAIVFGRLHRYSAEALKTAAQDAADAVIEKVEKLLADEPKITFIPGKTFDAAGWTTTYNNAVNANAVLKSGTALKSLTTALTDLRKARDMYVWATQAKPMDSKNLRAMAEAYVEKLEVAEGAITMVKGLKGYGRNETMATYLDGLMKDVADQRDKATNLEADASASSDKFVFVAKNDGALKFSEWRANKAMAARIGLVVDGETGVGDAITQFLAAKDKLQKQLKAKKDADKEIKAMGEAQVKLNGLLIKVRGESENKEWVKYVNSLIDALAKEVETV